MDQKRLNANTIKAYRIDITQFISFLNQEGCDTLSKETLQSYIAYLDRLLEEDVDIRYIQQLLGHSSISTTQIYAHVSSEKRRTILSTKHPRNKISVG